jgi:hypothetical protein
MAVVDYLGIILDPDGLGWEMWKRRCSQAQRKTVAVSMDHFQIDQIHQDLQQDRLFVVKFEHEND